MRGFSEYKTSALVLIAANALPLFGVLFLGWDTFSIVALYWTENVIIGAINVLKMIACNPDPAAIDWSQFKASDQLKLAELQSKLTGSTRTVQLANHGMKLLMVPFFIVHYGLFCFVHGVFVFALFGHEPFGFGIFGPLGNIGQVFSEQRMWWFVIALAASHLCSFFVNFLGRSEYRRTAVPLLMIQPYARIIVLHVAILLGGFVSMVFGSNAGVLIILIIGKTMLDLSLHLRERMRNAMTQSPETPTLPDVITSATGESLATPRASAQSHPPVRSSSGD
jgi:Family of unknown function (DUF6498)